MSPQRVWITGLWLTVFILGASDIALGQNLSAREFNERASARQAKGDMDGAIADFTKAIELNPKYTTAYYDRGNAWLFKEEYDKAIADYNEAIRLDPKNAFAYRFYSNRGVAWEKKQVYDKAIQDYDEVIRLNPKRALSYNNRGNCWREKKQYDRAIQDYDEAIRLDPPNAATYRIGRRTALIAKEQSATDKTEKAGGKAAPQPLPDAPKGYSWERAVEAKSAFLRPDAWHFRRDAKGDTLAYFITKEPITPSAKFETGFSINIVRRFPQATGMKPTDYARHHIESMKDSVQLNIEKTNEAKVGDLAGFDLQIHDQGGGKYAPLRMHMLLLGNDETGTIYQVVFETPVTAWDKEWPIAEPVFKQLVLGSLSEVAKPSKGELDKALADYNETIRLDPKDANAYYNRGNAWWGKGELNKALADYSEAIRLDSKYAPAYYNRGVARQAKGELDEALADFNETIHLDPKNALAYNNRGGVWQAKRELDQALTDYDEAIRLDPKFTGAYYNRGAVRQAKGDLDKAVADYNQAIHLDPKFALAYNGRSRVWSHKGEWDKTLADYAELIRLDPKAVDTYNERAWLYATCPNEKFRDGAKAVEDGTTACELSGWKNAGVLDTLAAAYAEAGQFDKAVETQQKAKDLAPENNKANYQTRIDLYKSRKPYRQELKAK